MPRGARQYRSVRDDLAQAAHDLKAAERGLQERATLRLIAVRDNRRVMIERYTKELEAMFHPDAAAFIVEEITRHA